MAKQRYQVPQKVTAGGEAWQRPQVRGRGVPHKLAEVYALSCMQSSPGTVPSWWA